MEKSSEPPDRSNIYWRQHGPMERLALVEHHSREMAAILSEMRREMNAIASRLWMLDIIETLFSLIKDKLLTILGRAVEVGCYAILFYLATKVQWIASHAPPSFTGQ